MIVFQNNAELFLMDQYHFQRMNFISFLHFLLNLVLINMNIKYHKKRLTKNFKIFKRRINTKKENIFGFLV